MIALRAMAVPARSPARPPSASILWVAGRGNGPVPRPGNAGTQIEEAGFSLIEALVALAVLAIATVGRCCRANHASRTQQSCKKGENPIGQMKEISHANPCYRPSFLLSNPADLASMMSARRISRLLPR